MSADLRSILINLAYPIATIVIVWVVTRIRGLSWVPDLLLIWPSWRVAAIWLIGWFLWIVVSEFISDKLGLPRPPTWESRSAVALAVHSVTLVIISPIADELVFRGILFQRLTDSKVGPIGATIISAGLFALLHFQYGWKQDILIFLDGVIYAVAFYFSESLLLTIMMHSIGNLYAVYQRLPSRS
jgi:membrane protease YdiL (CAAX protease family)